MDIDSILNLYSNTYLNLPRPVKSFLGQIYGSIPLEVRFGKEYKINKRLLDKYENSDKQFQLDFVYNKTFETLQFAFENIPHYRNIFNEFGFDPKNFKSIDDLKNVPLLTKKIVQNNLENLYTNKKDKPIRVQTGGSTFTPTKFYVSLQKTRAKERAYNDYIFSKLGYVYRDRTLVLRASDTSNKNVYWNYERVANHLWVSANHISPKYIDKITQEVALFKPKYVWGYPSAVAFFVNQCIKKGMDHMKGVSGVFLTSEIIFPEQRKKVADFFNCPVLSHYGHRESTTIAYRIDQKPYNFLNSYGATRVVDNEIITTSFDNFVMPFINYKTQDFVTGNSNFIEKSDLVSSIEEIEGRLQDFMVTKEGTVRTAMGIGMGHSNYFEFVEAAQYYQDTPGKVTINIESASPEKVNVIKLIQEMEDYVKKAIEFNVRFVDKIEKTPLGKWKTCVQKLDIEKYK